MIWGDDLWPHSLPWTAVPVVRPAVEQATMFFLSERHTARGSAVGMELPRWRNSVESRRSWVVAVIDHRDPYGVKLLSRSTGGKERLPCKGACDASSD